MVIIAQRDSSPASKWQPFWREPFSAWNNPALL
jgi:hypothetical protein